MRLSNKVVERITGKQNAPVRSKRKFISSVQFSYHEDKVQYIHRDGNVTGYQLHPSLYKGKPPKSSGLPPSTNRRKRTTPAKRIREKHQCRDNKLVLTSMDYLDHHIDKFSAVTNHPRFIPLDDTSDTQSEKDLSQRLADMLSSMEDAAASQPSKKWYFCENWYGYLWDPSITEKDMEGDYRLIVATGQLQDGPVSLVVDARRYFNKSRDALLMVDFRRRHGGGLLASSWIIPGDGFGASPDNLEAERSKAIERYFSKTWERRNWEQVVSSRLYLAIDQETILRAWASWIHWGDMSHFNDAFTQGSLLL